MSERKVLAIEVDTFARWGSDAIAVPVSDLLQRVHAAINRIPAEFRQSATLRVKAVGEDALAYLTIDYQRPETDEELSSPFRPP